MEIALILAVVAALAAGLLIGWLVAGRQNGALNAERDLHRDNFKKAIADLGVALEERDAARIDFAALKADASARDEAFAAQIAMLEGTKEALSAQFSEVGGKLLGEAQRQFLERADARFKQAEEATGQGIKALIQPVHDRLQKYEEAVGKVEAERREAFGNLHGLMESMRVSNESVRTEAARLGNSLRNAPKARGRWGEQQLKNVLESCGLSEHCDFHTEVSVTVGDGRLRPDVVVRVPGGRTLVIDAKVSLNAYQDAFEAGDESGKLAALTAHSVAMKAHVNALGGKAYQDQFDASPDYVIMFVPGEHFLTAALEHDPHLWDFAFAKRVLLATPTNLVAIARTVGSVWRQEKLVGEASQIAEAARELYARLAAMGNHVARLRKNLDNTVETFNDFVGSLDTKVITQAKRFETLGVDTGGKNIDAPASIDVRPKGSLKLVAGGDAD